MAAIAATLYRQLYRDLLLLLLQISNVFGQDYDYDLRKSRDADQDGWTPAIEVAVGFGFEIITPAP